MYDFWDYLPGALVFGALFGPLLLLLAFKIWIVALIWVKTLSGQAYTVSEDAFARVRIHAHDHDEDGY